VHAVDTEGYWYGNRGFNYSHSLYQYTSQIRHTFSEYQAAANSLISETMVPMGKFMQHHNLGINLLLLMTYQTTITDPGNDQDTDTFLFSPTPAYIFDNGVYSADAGTIDSLCDVEPSVTFDRANAKFNVKYNHSQFANSSACMNAFDPYHLGYDPEWSGEDFDIAIGDTQKTQTQTHTHTDTRVTRSALHIWGICHYIVVLILPIICNTSRHLFTLLTVI
jgi:hypothetical protein